MLDVQTQQHELGYVRVSAVGRFALLVCYTWKEENTRIPPHPTKKVSPTRDTEVDVTGSSWNRGVKQISTFFNVFLFVC